MTLFILDYQLKRGRQLMKTALVYAGASVFCVVFDRLYAIFGHGVYSPSMSLMFLYPLVGGTLAFSLLLLLKPAADAVAHYRVYYNLYNSGVATLTLASLLSGIFEIAGTSSPYTALYFLTGCLLAAAGAAGFLISDWHARKDRSPTI